MKALHAIPANKEHRWTEFIQVKNGFVYSANTTEFVKIPAIEVFGKGIIKDDEELYFDKNLWLTSSMQDASKIRRDGNLFTALLKSVTIGLIMPIGQVGENSGELLIGNVAIKFPDFNKMIAQGKPVLRVGVNETSLCRVGAALGSKNLEISRVNNDPKFPHIVQAYSDTSSTGIGCSAGLDGLIYEHGGEYDVLNEGEATGEQLFTQSELTEALEEKDKAIGKLTEEVDELKVENDEFLAKTVDLQTVDLIGSTLTYKTDNVQLQEIMDAFIEVLRTAQNPREGIETLQMLC
ncbi:hypothetical protein ACN9ML_18495 [Dyadobacter endophyticus]|uniref:hypothetical protein n=1 Tax=Dyadobacter endophyticus TaxID=1749036 RepID=UPI003CF71A42